MMNRSIKVLGHVTLAIFIWQGLRIIQNVQRFQQYSQDKKETDKESHQPLDISGTLPNISSSNTHDTNSIPLLPLLEVAPQYLTLSDLIDVKTKEVKVDVSEIIDFAIIGNPKTGTSFLVNWLKQHKDIIIPVQEMRFMLKIETGPGLTVQRMLPLYKAKTITNRIGYKCPADVRELRALRNLRNHFYRTKLIVGLRHPVLWFQSFYNYRIREGSKIPPAMECRGPCSLRHNVVCTYNAYFHHFLAQMGSTERTKQEEQDLLRHYDSKTLKRLPYNLTVLDPPSTNPVFLYDQNQIDGRRFPKVAEAFRHDLSAYLNISLLTSLEGATQNTYKSLVIETGNMTSPTGNNTQFNRQLQTQRETRLLEREKRLIDICEPHYQQLRDELILVGKNMAEWIQMYLLPLPHVTTSSPEFFRKALEKYKLDPCAPQDLN